MVQICFCLEASDFGDVHPYLGHIHYLVLLYKKLRTHGSIKSLSRSARLPECGASSLMRTISDLRWA